MIYSLLVTFSLIGSLVGLIYMFLTWNFDYWKKRGVKGPTPTPLFGNFPNMIKQKQNVEYDLQKIYQQYCHDEDFVGVYSIRTPNLMVVNPELAHKILVTDFKNFRDNEVSNWFDKKSDKLIAMNPFVQQGEEWKERRQEVTPGLTANRIKAVYPVVQEVCDRLVEYMREKTKTAGSAGIDAKDMCLRYTSEVVSDCVLGVKAQSLTDNPTPILEMTKKLFAETKMVLIYSFLAGLWPKIRSIYKAKFFAKEIDDFFLDLIGKAINIRRNDSAAYADRVDFLNYILQLQEKKNISNEDLVSHSMTFLLDGFETSAFAITGCLYQLSKYPDKQEKLRKEILSNLNKEGRLDFEKVDSLPYLDQCFHESLRIIPVALSSSKLCTETCELTNKNGTKVQLNPGEIIAIPIYSFHHDERYFPNPNEFIPERFDSENGGTKKYRDMGAFLPFSDGPRICLGMRFALTITKSAIAMIVKNFNVKLNSKTRKDNVLHPTSFLGTLDGGVWLDLEEIH